MTDQTVTDPFAEIAAELRRIADDIDKLVGSGLPKPSHVALTVHPGDRKSGPSTKQAVDALAVYLFGHEGEVQKMGNGTYHYSAEGLRGPVSVSLYNSVPTEWAVKAERDSRLAKREAELERLRAEIAELRAKSGQ